MYWTNISLGSVYAKVKAGVHLHWPEGIQPPCSQADSRAPSADNIRQHVCSPVRCLHIETEPLLDGLSLPPSAGLQCKGLFFALKERQINSVVSQEASCALLTPAWHLGWWLRAPVATCFCSIQLFSPCRHLSEAEGPADSLIHSQVVSVFAVFLLCAGLYRQCLFSKVQLWITWIKDGFLNS